MPNITQNKQSNKKELSWNSIKKKQKITNSVSQFVRTSICFAIYVQWRLVKVWHKCLQSMIKLVKSWGKYKNIIVSQLIANNESISNTTVLYLMLHRRIAVEVQNKIAHSSTLMIIYEITKLSAKSLSIFLICPLPPSLFFWVNLCSINKQN